MLVLYSSWCAHVRVSLSQLKCVVVPHDIPRLPSAILSNRLSQAVRPLGLSLSGLKAQLGRPSFRKAAKRGTATTAAAAAAAMPASKLKAAACDPDEEDEDEDDAIDE